MYIRIAFSIELRLRVSRSLRSLANDDTDVFVKTQEEYGKRLDAILKSGGSKRDTQCKQ